MLPSCDRWEPRGPERDRRGARSCSTAVFSSAGAGLGQTALFIFPLPLPRDGHSVPSARSRPSSGSVMKKNSSVHKSLLLLSLPLAPTRRAFWRERKESTWTDRAKPASEEAKVGLLWAGGSQETSCIHSCQVRACGAGWSLWESQGTSLTWVSTSALASSKLGGLDQPPHHLSLHGWLHL